MQKNNDLSPRFFEIYKEQLLTKAPLISRVELCKMLPFLKRNTLRNQDYEDPEKKGIGKVYYINGKAYYDVNDVILYIKKKFCNPENEKEITKNEIITKRPQNFSYKSGGINK